MSSKIHRWKTEKEETLLVCPVFTLSRRQMRREIDGQLAAEAHDFFILHPPDWVNVVALTDSDELVLFEQWRHGVERTTLEVPGGMLDPGERPIDAAKRELSEETGFEAREWFSLGRIEPNPAIQTNRTHVFLARGAFRAGEPRFDATEHGRPILRPYGEIASLVADGTISHALVVVALHYESLRRSGQLTPRPVES